MSTDIKLSFIIQVTGIQFISFLNTDLSFNIQVTGIRFIIYFNTNLSFNRLLPLVFSYGNIDLSFKIQISGIQFISYLNTDLSFNIQVIGIQFISYLNTDLSFNRSLASSLQLRREFKYEPDKCKDVDMINYLLDSYDRVAGEERTAPKVI